MSKQQDIQQAIQYFQAGKLKLSEKLLKLYIAQFPDDVNANLLAAAILASKNDFETVIKHCKKVLEFDPTNINASYNAAVASEKLHNYQDVISYSSHVLQHDKYNAPAILQYITALIALGRQSECPDFISSFPEQLLTAAQTVSMKVAECYMAITEYDKALKIFRRNISTGYNTAECFHNIAIIMDRQDNMAAAIQAYQSAISAAPDVLASNYNLAFMLNKSGNNSEALITLHKCFEIQDSLAVRQAFVQIVSTVSSELVDDITEKHLLEVVADKETDAQSLSIIVADILRHKSSLIEELFQKANAGDYSGFLSAFNAGICELSDNLLLRLCFANLPITNYSFECFTKMLRTALLTSDADSQGLEELSAALAIRCYINGYVFTTTAEEDSRLDELIKVMQEDKSAINEREIAVVSMYISLYELHIAKGISFKSTRKSEIFIDLIKLQLEDNLSEEKIYESISINQDISDKTSLIVQQQYEGSPYPVWQRLSVRQQVPVKQIIDNVTAYQTNFEIDSKRPDILIAGCGTGSHAIQTAMRFEHKSLVAIDLSRRSLSYAKRKAVEYSFDNITFKQLDILHVSKLGKQFDIIESVGVLHHMLNPLAGFQSLVDSLKPGGLMNIGLYSKLGRRFIIQAKSLFDDPSRHVSDDEIRQLRIDIMNSGNEELVKNISGFKDFYSLHDCRDLIFHENENNYDVAELDRLISDAGMEFVGFDLYDPVVLTHFRQMFLQKGAHTNIKNWQVFEEKYPDEFSSMYVFWCRKPT